MLGIVKAYTTRVGSGPFPTELDDDTGQRLGERGREFGTVTGRKRRCGWFDAVLVRQSAAVSGITGIALTKIDVLDGFETVKICTGYTIGDTTYDYLPPHAADQARATPVYEEMPGWEGTTAGARSWADLPAQAIKYVRRIEELIRCPVALVSTSPRTATTPFWCGIHSRAKRSRQSSAFADRRRAFDQRRLRPRLPPSHCSGSH